MTTVEKGIPVSFEEQTDSVGVVPCGEVILVEEEKTKPLDNFYDVTFEADAMDRVLVPPLNFAMVSPGIYRSGYPNRKSYAFLRRLGLRSVLYLCPDPISRENAAFFDRMEWKVFHLPIDGNKEPFTFMDKGLVCQALGILFDKRNHPILMHCNKGKHRVGCVVGILRKMQQWSIASIFDEYRRFAGMKMRLADQEYIELFDGDPLILEDNTALFQNYFEVP